MDFIRMNSVITCGPGLAIRPGQRGAPLRVTNV